MVEVGTALAPPTGRIAARFASLRDEGRGGLITFLEAFDPDETTSLALLQGLPNAGADLIEIGMPFTDPVADGPSIQAAGLRGLAAGATVPRTLAMLRSFRQGDTATPVVLMGYLNPILAYGSKQFCIDAAAAGADGLIVVDLPMEEAALLADDARANGLDVIQLVTPTTDDARLAKLLQGTSGFIYYVSVTGITGTRSATATDLAQALPRIRRMTDLPVAIGFGVRSPQQAANAVSFADAAVVGSALCDTLAGSLDEGGRAGPSTVSAVLRQVAELAESVRNQALD